MGAVGHWMGAACTSLRHARRVPPCVVAGEPHAQCSKPLLFLSPLQVPSGLLPVLEVNGQVITESAVIQQASLFCVVLVALVWWACTAAAAPNLYMPEPELPGPMLPLPLAQVLEQLQPEPAMLPPAGSEERQRAAALMRLERQLFSAWLQWLCNGW